MITLELFLIFVATLLTGLYLYDKFKYRNFPKGKYHSYIDKQTLNICSLTGPLGLPIIGYLPFLGPTPHRRYAELAKTYGNIYSLMFGLLP